MKVSSLLVLDGQSLVSQLLVTWLFIKVSSFVDDQEGFSIKGEH